MKLQRRNFLCLAAGAAALPILSHIAGAQAWPTRPVRLIVPFAAGGATDIFARLIGQWLSNHLGQQFVIENRPGAATNIGSEVVAKATPDVAELGGMPVPGSPDDFRKLIADETEKWGKVIRAANIKPE